MSTQPPYNPQVQATGTPQQLPVQQPPVQQQQQQAQGQPVAYQQAQLGQQVAYPAFANPQQVPGQPTYIMQQASPGGITYYPHAQGGMPQMVVGAQVVYARPPKYEYTPNSFKTMSLLTIVICGVFSPLSLIFSIPALLYANKSQVSAKEGSIKVARSQGMVAAYLNTTAILFALLLAIILTGLIIGLYAPSYYFNKCLKDAERQYGTIPEFDLDSEYGSDYYRYSSTQYYC